MTVNKRFQHSGMIRNEEIDLEMEEKNMKKLIASVLTGVIAAGLISTTAFANETITVAASAAPHAEILEQAAPLLAEMGYDLEVTVFNDYVQPNEVVEAGDFDANYFQHIPYLDSYNEEKGTHLVNAGGIHYEPFGIYPGQKASLDDIADGDSIAVPNDTTNEARALLLLQDNGLLTLEEGAGLTATINQIVDNPKNLEIVELEAAQIPHNIQDVAYAVMNGNYALEAGFSVGKDALAYESVDSEAAKTYVNVIAVKEGNEENEGIKALVEVLKSEEIQKFINETYDGAVIPFVESEEAPAEAAAEEAPAADGAAADASALPAAPEFEPNKDYAQYTTVEYTIEDLGEDMICTVSADADLKKFDIQCNFFGDDQDWAGEYDAAAKTVTTTSDKTGFMEGDAPKIIEKALEQNIWVPVA